MKQVLLAAFDHIGGTTPSTSATNYCPISGSNNGNNSYETIERRVSLLFPCAGTIANLKVTVATQPGSGKSYAFTARVNEADSTLTCSIADTNTSASDSTHSVSVSAGDRINVKIIPTGTPASTGALRISCDFTPTTDSQYALFAGTSTAQYAPTSGQVAYLCPANGIEGGFDGTEANMQIVIPHATTIQAFYVNSSVAPGIAKTTLWKLYINGVVDVTSVITLTGNAQTTGNATGLSIALAQGDTLSIGYVDTGGAASANVAFGIQLSPTTNGESILAINSDTQLPNTGQNNYQAWNSMNGNWKIISEAATMQFLCGLTDFALKKMTVKIDTAAGASKTWTFTNRKNSANGTLTFTITGTSQVTNTDNTHTDSYTSGDTLDLAMIPTSTPAGIGHGRFSVVQFITPAVTTIPNRIYQVPPNQAVNRAATY